MFVSVLAFCVCGRALCPAGMPKGRQKNHNSEHLTALWEGIKMKEVTLILSQQVNKKLLSLELSCFIATIFKL